MNDFTSIIRSELRDRIHHHYDTSSEFRNKYPSIRDFCNAIDNGECYDLMIEWLDNIHKSIDGDLLKAIDNERAALLIRPTPVTGNFE